jgi:hypothetical protein
MRAMLACGRFAHGCLLFKLLIETIEFLIVALNVAIACSVISSQPPEQHKNSDKQERNQHNRLDHGVPLF